MNKIKAKNQKLKELYRPLSDLPNPEFLKKYKLTDRRKKQFLINSFSQIGWTDPFEEEGDLGDLAVLSDTGSAENSPQTECIRFPTDADQDVYPQSYYRPGQSPSCVYIPSREIMFKMMRACIGIQEEDDLWINNDVDGD